MMKRLILLFVLLMVVNIEAEVSARFDSLLLNTANLARLKANDSAAVGDNDITLKKIKRQVNYAIQQVCQDFPAIEKYDTVAIDSSMEGGALPSDFSRVINVSFMSGDILRIPIMHVPDGDSLRQNDDQIDENRHNKSDTMSVKSWRVHSGKLEVHPKWSSGGTANYLLQYYALDSNLTNDSSVTQVRAKYRDKIILYATSRLFGMRMNVFMAEYWMKEYEKGIVKNED